MKRLSTCFLLLGIILIVVIGCTSKSIPAVETTGTIDTAAQQQRLNLIQQGMDLGVFQKVVSGEYPEVWVASKFYIYNFDDKQNVISVVYAYYHTADPKCEMIYIYDSMTGKRIGKYGAFYGGLKLD